LKSGSLNLLETLGLSRPVMGFIYLYLIYVEITGNQGKINE
jgi:hypothetical protein